MAFSFSFSGDDIDAMEEDTSTPTVSGGAPTPTNNITAPETGSLRRPSGSKTAFPIPGQEMLPARTHTLDEFLEMLPERINYSMLDIKLEVMDNNLHEVPLVRIPRRELWDVRMQIMAESAMDGESGAGGEALGQEDVKTGVYEGGFKSWECSVDLVRVLAERQSSRGTWGKRILEMGCGTALPSMACFQWAQTSEDEEPVTITLADYNPTVLQLVTVPNLILSWAYTKAKDESFAEEGDVEITAELIQNFKQDLKSRRIELQFLSGTWSPEFVQQYADLTNNHHSSTVPQPSPLLVIAAETIYSPAALSSFAETLMSIIGNEDQQPATALVGAKKVYFGVGGSMEDFCQKVRAAGASVVSIREEEGGVRREVVEIFGRSVRLSG